MGVGREGAVGLFDAGWFPVEAVPAEHAARPSAQVAIMTILDVYPRLDVYPLFENGVITETREHC